MKTKYNLEDTVELMKSADYKDRFVAEYRQLVYRIQKLEAMLVRYRHGMLEFKPTCPYETLDRQLGHMEKYAKSLRERAILENIEL